MHGVDGLTGPAVVRALQQQCGDLNPDAARPYKGGTSSELGGCGVGQLLVPMETFEVAGVLTAH